MAHKIHSTLSSTGITCEILGSHTSSTRLLLNGGNLFFHDFIHAILCRGVAVKVPRSAMGGSLHITMAAISGQTLTGS